jgi:MFS family permease
MTNMVSAEAPTTRNARRAAVSGFFGSALEYYDFLVCATAAALVFNHLFFPKAGETGTLLSIGTFAVAYVARPFGAVLWGHIGDRLGRRYTLVLTIVVMGASTFLVGCLPTYDQIGIFAPVLLIVLRLFQGLSAGGESPGASSLTVEHAPPGRRAFYTGFAMSGLQAGISLGSMVFVPLTLLPPEQLFSWGWRLPFLISGVLTVVAYMLRRKLDETEVFAEMEESGERARMPILVLVRDHWAATLRVTICCTINVVSSIFNVFALSYATGTAHIPQSFMLIVVTVGNALAIVLAPVSGWLSDRVGRRPVFIVGALASSSLMFAVFAAIEAGNLPLLLASGTLAIGVFNIMPIAVGAAWYPEMFPPKVRYTGMAVGLMLGVLAAGFAPVIAQAFNTGHGTPWPAAWVCLGVGVLAAASALTGPETYRVPTDELGKKPLPKAG